MKPEKQKVADEITAAISSVVVGETTSKKIAKAIANAAEKLAKKIAKIKKTKAEKEKKKAKKEAQKAKKEAKKAKKEIKKAAKTPAPITINAVPEVDSPPTPKTKKIAIPKNDD
jgi:glycine cleavage system pyridoxal-binding protein P